MEPGKLLDPPSHSSSASKKSKKTHECSECGKFFAGRSLLLTHRKVHVGSGSSQGLEVWEILCWQVPPFDPQEDPCGKWIQSRFGGHKQLSEKPPKTHECSECGKSFDLRSLLLTHRKIHVGSRSSQ
ncbi:hypothetical protein E2320_014352, partial [Naja naja]